MNLPFTNQNVWPEQLPSLEAIEFQPLESAYLKVERISVTIILCVLLMVGGALFAAFYEWSDLLLLTAASVVFLAFAALLFVSTEISFRRSGYALREQDIIYRSGWIVQKERIVMLNRVQHVSVQSGPMERNFGLASVSLYTAGASGADFTIRGIKEETAQRIKAWVSTRLNGERS